MPPAMRKEIYYSRLFQPFDRDGFVKTSICDAFGKAPNTRRANLEECPSSAVALLRRVEGVLIVRRNDERCSTTP